MLSLNLPMHPVDYVARLSVALDFKAMAGSIERQ